MTRLLSTAPRKIISIFLAFILTAGTITAFYPSSSITTQVHALSEHGGNMINYDNYKSTKDSSVDKKDNEACNNFNLNLNGFNDVDAIPESLDSLLLEDQKQAEEDKDIGTGGAYYGGNDGSKARFVGHNDKDFEFVCKNNNEFIVSPTPPIPPTPPEVNNVCTVWFDDTDTPGNNEIFFAFSTDGGLTFSEPDNISETTGNSLGPQVICEGNNVYVVWQDEILGSDEIFFAFSTDGGLTFSEPDNISETTEESFDPQISSEGNNVYVVWSEELPDNDEIFFAFSTDGGLTFSEPENISETATDSLEPQISSEGNNVYVVWEEDTPANPDFPIPEIFFAFSTDGGQTFSTPDNLSENAFESFNPQISSEGNNVYVVWDDNNAPGNIDIFFVFSTDGGLTFSEPENISENLGSSSGPQISSEGNNVYVVWDGSTDGNNDIFFAFSTDGGLTFSEPENISENAGLSIDPQISSEGNNIYVVWTEFAPDFSSTEIFFSVSTDGGLTFSDPDNLSESAGNSFNPQISSEGNNVYVVWNDDTDNLGINDIFFAFSTDGGLTFSEPENISENTGDSRGPDISSSTS